MTTQEAIRELQNIRQYCAAKSIPAVDFALKVLREKLEQEWNEFQQRVCTFLKEQKDE